MPTVPGSSTIETATPVDALASFRSEIDAMADKDVLTPRVDVAAAALTAIGALPAIEAQRTRVVSFFGEAGGRALDQIGPVARSLMFAQAGVAAVAEHDVEAMARDVMDARNALFNAGSALVERELLSEKALPKLIGGQGYQARVVDVFTLTKWFRQNARLVASHTKVSEAQLVAAEALALDFSAAYSQRDQASAVSSTAASDRARMFTIFFRTYERVRKMLTYLRWREGDADRIAPSIYAGRGGRKSERVAPPAPTDTTDVVPPGMPGADPFRNA